MLHVKESLSIETGLAGESVCKYCVVDANLLQIYPGGIFNANYC